MKEYSAEILQRVQNYELEILKDFISVCDENELPYFGIAGTGIGAVRHHGMIPWDDDIDVAMLRHDMDVLKEQIIRKFPNKYLIIDAEKYEDYPLMTTQIVLKHSIFISEALPNINCPLGIFLDVFPLDVVASSKRRSERQFRCAWFLSKIMILTTIRYPIVHGSVIKQKIMHCITAFVFYFLKFIRIDKQKVYKKLFKVCTAYNDSTMPVAYAYFCDTHKYDDYFLKEDLFPPVSYEFDSIPNMKFPSNLNKHLSLCYGDYMQLPPPEKRCNHFPQKLKFPDEDIIYSYE